MSRVNKHRARSLRDRRLGLELLECRHAVSTFLFAPPSSDMESDMVGAGLPGSGGLDLDSGIVSELGSQFAERDVTDTPGDSPLRLAEGSSDVDRSQGERDTPQAASDAVFASDQWHLGISSDPFPAGAGLAIELSLSLPPISSSIPNTDTSGALDGNPGTGPSVSSATGGGSSGGAGGAATVASSAGGRSPASKIAHPETAPTTVMAAAVVDVGATGSEQPVASAVAAMSTATAATDSAPAVAVAPADVSPVDAVVEDVAPAQTGSAVDVEPEPPTPVQQTAPVVSSGLTEPESTVSVQQDEIEDPPEPPVVPDTPSAATTTTAAVVEPPSDEDLPDLVVANDVPATPVDLQSHDDAPIVTDDLLVVTADVPVVVDNVPVVVDVEATPPAATSNVANNETASTADANPVALAATVAPLAVNDILTTADVQLLLSTAAGASSSEDAIIAVVDRTGKILGVRVEGGVVTSDMVFAIDGAVAKARTAAFFANDHAPLTSRTIRFISQTTITQREVQSNPNISDLNSTVRGPGFVAPIGLGGHFPPGVSFTPHVDLFAIEHTNRDSIVHPGANRLKETVNLNADGSVASTTGDDIFLTERFGADFVTFAAGEAVTAPESYGFVTDTNTAAQARGIATLPGGIPLFKQGGTKLVGGIGVFFPGPDGFADFEQGFQQGDGKTAEDRLNAPRVLEAEYIALAAADGAMFSPPRGRLDLVGIKLEVFGPHPFGESTLQDVGRQVGAGDPNSGSDVVVNNQGDLYLDGKEVPVGWLVMPKDSTDAGLTAAEVQKIIDDGVAEAMRVRAAVRLPLGSRTEMVLSVSDTNGEVLGLFRMNDATYFSIDVAVAKARNVSYYADPNDVQTVDLVDSNQDSVPDLAPGVAFTNRTFRFLSEPRFPSGIDGTVPGAFSILLDMGVDPTTGENLGAPVPASAHTSVLGFDAFHPGSNFREPVPTTGFQNGIVFFPGSTPLYKNGALVGGLGVSGDGVDQDDVVTFSGSGQFRPSSSSPVVRADEVFVDGVRLPFQKFLRNPRG